MKLRKLLSLVLAAVMFFGCMTITAFAGGDAIKSIALDRTSVVLTIGETVKLNATVMNENLDDVSSTTAVEWTSSDATVATVDNGTVTTIKTGTTAITVKPSGYDSLTATCNVTVVSGSTTLDLDTNTKKDIEQNYTFTQESEEYTDVTKVKLEWTITDIAATYTSNKTWDPDTLTWKETKTVADIPDKTAEFTLTNYSSKESCWNSKF